LQVDLCSIGSLGGFKVVIVPIFYTVAPWLVFFKLKIVPLNWMSGAVAALCGILILATLLALLNSLTPSGGIVVIGRVVELTPNVSGQVVAVSAKPAHQGRRGFVQD